MSSLLQSIPDATCSHATQQSVHWFANKVFSAAPISPRALLQPDSAVTASECGAGFRLKVAPALYLWKGTLDGEGTDLSHGQIPQHSK
jgi:hypothetical protein